MTNLSTTIDQANLAITVRVPLRLRKLGGRKLVITPPAAAILATPPAQQEDAVIKAIARAHRWSRLLEAGQFDSIAALAAAEKIDKSYLSKILRLTLLAPDVVEMILGGQTSDLQVEHLLQPFPLSWASQRDSIVDMPSING